MSSLPLDQRVERAMKQFEQMQGEGREAEFYREVHGGPPKSWWFRRRRRIYPVKATWAAAVGLSCNDFYTKDAKRELSSLGYGNFFQRDKNSNLPELTQSGSRVDDLIDAAADRHGGGEGDEHLNTKLFVSEHPAAVGLNDALAPGVEEFRLPSGDAVDVVFMDSTGIWGVEVKPAGAPESDVLRGMFQCIKYKAVLEAKAKLGGHKNVDVRLALGGNLSPELSTIRDKLRITVIENVRR